jgi:putative transposase
MSRPGNCYDNAAMESFWSSLKRELVHRCQFATRAEARAAIFEWIEVLQPGAVPQRPRLPITCGL